MNKKKMILVCIFIVVLLVIFYYSYLVINLDDGYKLGKIGYSDSEIEVIEKDSKLRDYAHDHDYDKYLIEYVDYDINYNKMYLYSEYIDKNNCSVEDAMYLINNGISYEYSENLVSLVKEKYFISSRLYRYIDYLELNESLSYKEVVTLVNCNRDYDYYTFITKSDITKGLLVISNKYYQLPSDYASDNLVTIDSKYAKSSNLQVDQEAYNAFIKLHDDAASEGYSILAASTYRTYEYQSYLYNRSVLSNGSEYADSHSARAGHSEHQTGLAIDVLTSSIYSLESFTNTKEYSWMLENCYKYGFILRYPSDMINQTGYSFESWHYRYVGIEVATQIHEENISFDEYYAYYVLGE